MDDNTLAKLSERIADAQPQPMVLVIDHVLARLSGLPVGSVQPSSLVERRLWFFVRGPDA